MAWNVPMTAIAGQIVASADFNLFVRDNLNLTEAALALDPDGGFFVSTGLHTIAQRIITTSTVDVSEATASTSYANLATTGPTVTVTTGTKAIVIVGCRAGDNSNTAGNPSNKMSWACSGATTIAAADDWAAGLVQLIGQLRAVYTSNWRMVTGLTPGSNTFQAKYSVSSGTGNFDHRSMHVLPL
jgi:hypothetical protein